MFEYFLTGEPPAAVRAATVEASSSPEGELLARQFSEGLSNIGPAIALAGAAYPVILATGYSIVGFIYLCVSQPPGFPVEELVVAPLMFSFFGAVVGLMWASMVAVAVLPLVYLFVRSLELHGSIVQFGAFCGGLVGFVAVMPLTFGITMTDVSATPTEFAFILLLGPGLTTVIGQAGGAWGGWRTRWYERAVVQASVEEGKASRLNDRGTAPKRLQFRIWHLLVISLWASLFLTTIRLSGFGFGFAFTLVAAWAVYQTVTLWVGGLLARWIGRWRARRQSRST